MFRRKTSKVKNRHQVKILKANVMSPRIFWFDVRHAFAMLFKMVFWMALLGVGCWGLWMGVEKGLLENPEFKLQRIELSDNPAIDEIRLLNVTGIDPTGSLFDCDAGQIEESLRALPEVSAATVRREYPGTLLVDVSIREPMLWVASESQGIRSRDLKTGLVVDQSLTAFPCPRGKYEEALALPVIELREGGTPLKAGMKVDHPDFVRGMRLYSAAGSFSPDANEWIDTIWQHKSWASRMTTREGAEVTFGHDNLKRQMGDLLAAVQHANEKGARIATITLIGTRNLPVTYAEPPAPKAIFVEPAPEARITEESTPSPSEPVKVSPAIDRDLNRLLER
ncbi:cell division protein FtsQ/DivIB [Haloferula chungangensis]|uniref:Cell division protein FtsQ/DivIB n=1 Tax=Haloferula chungangensis TaxID=1048331 RepID=A0ABW2LBT0_9BACT